MGRKAGAAAQARHLREAEAEHFGEHPGSDREIGALEPEEQRRDGDRDERARNARDDDRDERVDAEEHGEREEHVAAQPAFLTTGS